MRSHLGMATLAGLFLITSGIVTACSDDPVDSESKFDAGDDRSDTGAGGEDSGNGSGDATTDGPVFGPLDDGGVDPNDLEDGGCANDTQEVELAPLDMLIALDTSFSMDFDEKWPSVAGAISSFTANQTFDGLGVALQYFPLRAQCSVSAYETPAVPFGTLPAVGVDIRTSLSKQQMSGGTPMVPVLQGTLTYAASYQQQHPDRRVVVVLATDGIPDDSCQTPPSGGLTNTVENAIAVVTQAQTGTGTRTFVIGVGDELTALNAIAQAGGTQSAVLVSTSSNVEQEFIQALNGIRKTSLSCDYDIPKPSAGQTLDFNKVNVRLTVGATKSAFYYVGTQANCGREPGQGWYYDVPTAPKKVILCPDACDRVRAERNGRVDVIFGCQRIAAR